MALLDEAIEASGGLAHWTGLKRFSLQLSIQGALLSRAGHAKRFKNIVAEGSTRSQLVRFSGFAEPGESGLYQPDSVTIEDASGNVLRTWREPHRALRDQAESTTWDELHFIFLCGFSVWNYLMTPFILSHPDTTVEELPPWQEANQLWRRLKVTFPPGVTTHSPVQTFYFDASGLQRRVDHALLDTQVAHYSWAHQAFGRVVIPTLRRSLALKTDGTVVRSPALLEVEIFDATFD
ncbi:hypothetical protein H8B02_07245 [Bradyrhizobium sp. Pear77]|uniref:hypothetical protein n=1 Tax=Bradyrhizobium altum TaxID=1571202 RepID=UPI001E64A59B|nr:hypothetical protein [Bradyrhizobium altum]MCC8953266.1 hypothetical protein [Bradyrhizobium altum]